ncbi:MAG: linear amide C-N hydrolase [Bacteroidota bacterium]
MESEYPLYVMHYVGPYRGQIAPDSGSNRPGAAGFWGGGCSGPVLGCSLFAALGDPENRLFGRNLQADYGPGLLLFTSPPDGYASVSMVNLKWLALAGDRSEDLTQRNLTDRQMLLYAPAVPFDGMNEKGLAIGMASIDSGSGLTRRDPQKKSISEFGIMREVLDHAATVQEAVDLMDGYNINMGGMPFHYLIASAAGDSALIEFYKGKMVVLRNEAPWQAATNFLVASKPPGSDGGCGRYSTLKWQLQEAEGRMSSKDALRLLYLVSEPNTRWRVLYHMTSGDLEVVMGFRPEGIVHSFHLYRTAP